MFTAKYSAPEEAVMETCVNEHTCPQLTMLLCHERPKHVQGFGSLPEALNGLKRSFNF